MDIHADRPWKSRTTPARPATAANEAGYGVNYSGHGELMLRATRFGVARSPTVLLLHGGGQTRHAWTDTARALAGAGYCAIALDARGHGESAWCPAGNYTASAFAQDLRNVMHSLPSAPYIVGASMGGLTAMLALGEDRSLACRGLALVDVAPRLESKGVQRIIAFMHRHKDGFDSLEQVRDAVSAYNPGRQTSRNPGGLRKNLRQDSDGRLYWHWDPAFLDHAVVPDGDTGMFCQARLNRAAQRLRMPVLLIRGYHSDVLSEEGARELLSLMPQAHYQVLDQAGHMVVGDRNTVFCKAVLDFLEDPHCTPQRGYPNQQGVAS